MTMPAIQHLFVYGSLQPGCSNADVLAGFKGEWQAGTVIGQLFESGWGADLGYPGLKLTDSGTPVSGQVLTSPDLADFGLSSTRLKVSNIGESWHRSHSVPGS